MHSWLTVMMMMMVMGCGMNKIPTDKILIGVILSFWFGEMELDTCPIRCLMDVFPLLSLSNKQFHIGIGFFCLQLSHNFVAGFIQTLHS